MCCGLDKAATPPGPPRPATPVATPAPALPRRASPRLAPHAYGRRGDLVLAAGLEGTRFTFADAEDLPGHRPIRGALVDADLGEVDEEDPLLYYRPGWLGADGTMHPLVSAPTAVLCTDPSRSIGVRIAGSVDGASLESILCPEDVGSLRATLTGGGLPEGARLADELVPGPSPVVVDRAGSTWEGTRPFETVAVEGPRSTWVLVGRGEAKRNFVRIAKEVFPSPVVLAYQGLRAERTLRILPARKPGPPSVPPAGRLSITVKDDRPLPCHVLVRGEAGTPDPELVDLRPTEPPRSFAHGSTVYTLDGRSELSLPGGRYEILATHGPGYTLERRHVTVQAGATLDLALRLRAVVVEPEWLSADLHLHAVPSPDSSVSLAARIASLACEGVELAVATDHNRITDYGPTARGLGTDRLPAFMVGDEITSGGKRLFGHFNAFPLAPVPQGVAPEEAALPYFDILPSEIFAAARRAGATIVQVNHPRMPPKIGYFDLTGLDARTGSAGPELALDFDAVEAHNGIWIESPERVREGVRDLVGLARRGKKAAATGNSDSHKLVYEEAGYPRTHVHLEGTGTPEARLIAGLRARHTTVSSGPFLKVRVDGALPGSVVRPKGREVSVDIEVIAPAWVPVEHVEIWQDDRVISRLAVPGPARDGVRFRRTVKLEARRDMTLTVWVDADTPLPPVLPYPDARAIAFTSPFYVDADGDGEVRPTGRE